MQNLFFLGIILVGKEKIPNKSTKTIQKQKPKKKSKHHILLWRLWNKHGRGSGRGGPGLKAP